ncbi:MAG: protein kinase [Acidobacteriota bacterium]|nr:protein kinase [Acidobacteriota bacterium]
MTIEPGKTLLHYRLVEQIGEGGMGVVWKATDTTLDREVAIKILPEAFAADAERLARFGREAKVLASLNHPNIAVIHGLHEVEGVRFLAMELVEGADVAQRLDNGPLPVDDALEIAQQIADALAAAHEQGVIHRDLKPANVRTTADGKVKVLDFGLAKAFDPTTSSGTADPGLSPTLTSAGTVAGMVLGTAAYMSPEQARGKMTDKRSDVWSFGCVLFEMLSGKNPFQGETVTDILAAIVHKEPDWKALPARTPARVRRLLQRCLRKDVRERLRDLGDIALLLREGGVETAAERAQPEKKSGGWLWPALTGVLAIALLVVLVTRPTGGDVTAGGLPHITGMTQLTDLPGMQISPSLSPNGKQMLYVHDRDIYLQRVGGENPINLTAGHPEVDFQPAFSPDGEKIAFCSTREGGGIFVMGATGESPKRVSDEGFDPAWSPDGRKLVYTTEWVTDPYSRSGLANLWIVDLETLERKKLHDIDAAGPSWSPGGTRIAFWTHLEDVQGQRDLYTIPADGGDPVAVMVDGPTDWNPVWSPDGRWLYFISDRGGSRDLWRIAIDESSGKVLGEPQAVTTGMARIDEAAVSAAGDVVVTTVRTRGEIFTVDFDPVSERPVGERTTLLTSSNPFTQLSSRFDNPKILYRTTAPRERIYIMEIDGSGRRKLVDDEHRNRGPELSPDGRWVAFYTNRTGTYDIWAIRVDGTGLKPVSADITDINDPVWMADGNIAASAIGETLGVFDLGDGGIEGLKGAAEIKPLPGGEGFVVSAVSSDGQLFSGHLMAETPPALAVYSIQEGTVELVRDADSTVSGVTPRWIDDHRLVFWSAQRQAIVLWDMEKKTLRIIPDIPGPSEVAFTNGGRTAVVNLTTSESDIWLLTLK